MTSLTIVGVVSAQKPQAEMPFLVLSVHTAEQIKKKVAILTEKIISSNIFSLSLQSIIKAWGKDFDEKSLKEFTSRERLNASKMLGELLIDIIYPVIKKCPEFSEEKNMLKAFAAEVSEILKSTLPEGRNVDDFLKQYVKKSAEYRLHLKKKAMIPNLFEELYKELDAIENATREQLLTGFEKLKSRLLILNSNRQLMTETMAKQLADLTAKISSIAEKCQRNLADMHELDKTLISKQQTFSSLLQECQKL